MWIIAFLVGVAVGVYAHKKIAAKIAEVEQSVNFHTITPAPKDAKLD